MGKIRIHGADQFRAGYQGAAEACRVGCAQAQFARPMDDLYAGINPRQLIRQRTGPIRRVVIHDDDIQHNRQAANGGDHGPQVFALVVSRQDQGRNGLVSIGHEGSFLKSQRSGRRGAGFARKL